LHQKLSTLKNLGNTNAMLETLISEKKAGGKDESRREQDKTLGNIPLVSVPVPGPVPGSPPSSPPAPAVIGSKYNVMAANQRLKERLANSIKSVTSSASILSTSSTPPTEKALPKVEPSEAEHGAIKSSADVIEWGTGTGTAPIASDMTNGHGDGNGAGDLEGENAIGERGTQPLLPETSWSR
jgi:hypothetical protein